MGRGRPAARYWTEGDPRPEIEDSPSKSFQYTARLVRPGITDAEIQLRYRMLQMEWLRAR